MIRETKGRHIRDSRDFLQKSYIYRRLINWRYAYTLVGRYLLVVAVISAFLSAFLINVSNIFYSLFYFSAFLFILSPFITGIFFPRMELTVRTPVRAGAGSDLVEELIINNPSGRDAHQFFVREVFPPRGIAHVDEQGIMVPYLKKGESVAVKLRFEVQKRGNYRFDSILLTSAFPLGVFLTGYRIKSERGILVYPRFHPLLSFNIPSGKKLQPGGIALASKLGESTEFLGTREFKDGDEPRHIHWKSWARMNKPIVKEFQEEYFSRIALLIDTFVPEDSPEQDYQAFESSLSLAASISDYLSRQEYIVDIIAAGPEIYYLQAGRALAYLDQILDILACLEVSRVNPDKNIEPALMEDLSQVTTVIVLLLKWDEERRDFLLRIRDMGVEMRIFLINNRENSIDLAAVRSFFPETSIFSSGDIERGFDTL